MRLLPHETASAANLDFFFDIIVIVTPTPGQNLALLAQRQLALAGGEEIDAFAITVHADAGTINVFA